jgi:hypothetical protein
MDWATSLRPLLMPSRLDDPVQKVGFLDGKWFTVAGGMGVSEATDAAVYFVMSLRNVGTGTAVLHGWWITGRVWNIDRQAPR